MIIFNGLPTNTVSAKAPQKAVGRPQNPQPRFAALVGRHSFSGLLLASEVAPAYNRIGEQAHATSFEAMPMVAAIAMELQHTPAVLKTASSDIQHVSPDSFLLNETDEGRSPHRRTVISALDVAYGQTPHWLGPEAIAWRVVLRAATALPLTATGTRPSALAPAAISGPDALCARGSRLPARKISDAIVMALGNGVSVHFHAQGSELRVTVRGLRLEAKDRGEIAGRVAKLMREHGHAVSEDMIHFEGAER